MKNGRSIVDIAQELQRQVETRKDFIAPQGKVIAEVIDGEVLLEGINGGPKVLTPYAHGQMGDNLEIPRKYYQRMQAEQPELLASNINTWLKADPDNQRMIRTLDNKVRAILSPKYRMLDNFHLFETVLPSLQEMNAQIMSCELTETRLYVKALLPQFSDELPNGLAFGAGHNRVGGDGLDRGKIVAMVVISNSEVGAGTFRIEPSLFTTWCTNLAILKQAAMKKYHIGRAWEADAAWEVLRDETRMADDRAFWMKVQDVTKAAFSVDLFRGAMEQVRAAGAAPIKSDNLQAVVEATVTELSLPKATSNGILKFLAAGGDLTKWGLSSAVTRVANEFESYEGATDLERAGGEIIALEGKPWERISAAA